MQMLFLKEGLEKVQTLFKRVSTRLNSLQLKTLRQKYSKNQRANFIRVFPILQSHKNLIQKKSSKWRLRQC